MPAPEWTRFAARVVANPARAVSLWKSVSGWRAACCAPGFPFPEILHSVELLPVFAATGGNAPSRKIPCDVRVPGPVPSPVDVEEALDRVEALAEWAESVTGRRCTEGALDRSLRSYAERSEAARALAAHCGSHPGFLSPETHRTLVDAGDFLPVESHARLLRGVLGPDAPTVAPTVPSGDPFLLLALRIR
jgi:hypothetical protein